ncbi:MAG: quinol monooxygenase YgiN [Halioglobus sp.]|jgi:quinol monooxygenase YgiN
MTTLLAKIQIHAGTEEQFEDVMAFMYEQTHNAEDDILRYEYWRGQKPLFYYCLLSFHDTLAFWRHQASDHHEGEMERFAECIADLELEVVDPVQKASPLPTTLGGESAAQALESESAQIKMQADLYPVVEANWWQPLRQAMEDAVQHPNRRSLEAGLAEIREAPADGGLLEMIVCRPAVGERKTLVEGELDTAVGLLGDNWVERGDKKSADGAAHPSMQLNIMNSRATNLVAGNRERWSLAGDQLYVDMDLSDANLPPGTQLSVGEAIIEVTAEPHLGCLKFVERFGKDAMQFVNSDVGKALNLRGINAKVVQRGRIALGDRLHKIS